MNDLRRIGEVVSPSTGDFIGLYDIPGSLYRFVVKRNGETVQSYDNIGDANRKYQKLAA